MKLKTRRDPEGLRNAGYRETLAHTKKEKRHSKDDTEAEIVRAGQGKAVGKSGEGASGESGQGEEDGGLLRKVWLP